MFPFKNGQIAEKFARIATIENKLRFLRFFWQKYKYDGPKYMLGIRIPVRLDPDLFKQIRIIERTMSRSRNELSASQSELWQNPPDLRTLILHIWIHYSTDRSFKTADF
jgi:hypothetical protein